MGSSSWVGALSGSTREWSGVSPAELSLVVDWCMTLADNDMVTGGRGKCWFPTEELTARESPSTYADAWATSSKKNAGIRSSWRFCLHSLGMLGRFPPSSRLSGSATRTGVQILLHGSYRRVGTRAVSSASRLAQLPDKVTLRSGPLGR